GALSLNNSALTTSEAGASASFSVRLSSQPSNDVTVSLAGLDVTEGLLMSANQLTFTSTNWNTAQLVQLAGLDDAELDGDIRYTLTATSASVDSHYQNKSATVVITNIDNETAGLQWNRSTVSTTESGGSSALSLVLNAQPNNDVTIAFSGLDTTEGSLSNSSLTFTAANWNTPQALTISGVEDSLVDGNIVYTLTATATSNDSRFNSKSAAVTVTNTDNDGPAFVLSKSSLITRETGSSSLFTVQLASQPSADVTVSLSGIDSTEGQLYTGSQLVFSHDNWNTPQMVLLAGVDDTLVDGDITYSLTLTSSSSDSSFQNKTASVAVTNIDNESAGLLFGETHLDTSESGGSSLFTVVLNS
ncbi:MAG: calcium-binding protein, partial [Methylococcaceae bacterium]|nr:calcium-binding protein [Methylococcaceae bacterium]